MNLDNKKVKHKSFGIGTIVSSNDSYIEVEFPTGKKKFVFPDAFAKFLSLVDEELGDKVDEMVEEKEKELLEEEEKLSDELDLLVKERQIKREQEKISKSSKSHNSLQAVFWCEEGELDEVFDEWSVFTGRIKSGAKEGQPNRLARINTQSSCLITTRDADEEEKSRTIRGLFMVKENFLGRTNQDGYMPAHSKYRIRLSEEESKKMLFWNYYVNNRYPDKTTWNTGRYRYFENIMVAQILKDIVSIKENEEERKFAQEFLDYFSKMNLIDAENIPEPNGTLKRI